MAFNCKARIYGYVDGVVYDPNPLYKGWSIDVSDGAGIGGNEDGLAANDNANVAHIDVYEDDYKIGTSAFGSSQLFHDDFSTNDFSQWATVHTGTPPVLTVSSAQLHLEFTDASIPGGAPDLGIGFVSTSQNFYVTILAKCNSPVHTTARSPGYSLIQGTGGQCWIFYYSDGIVFRAQSVAYATNLFTTTDTYVPLAMDDGDWHTVGVHFLLIPPFADPDRLHLDTSG